MNTFTTLAPVACNYRADAETLQVGKVYKVKFAGEEVRAEFLGTKVQTYKMRGLNHSDALRHWAKV